MKDHDCEEQRSDITKEEEEKKVKTEAKTDHVWQRQDIRSSTGAEQNTRKSCGWCWWKLDGGKCQRMWIQVCELSAQPLFIVWLPAVGAVVLSVLCSPSRLPPACLFLIRTPQHTPTTSAGPPHYSQGQGFNSLAHTLTQRNPHWYWIFGADADTNVREEGSSNIWYIVGYCTRTLSAEYCYQIDVTKTCNGGRISHILTNFILNISTVNSKHFTISF